MSRSTRTGFTLIEATSVQISESAPIGYTVALLSYQQELKPYRAVSGNGHLLMIREI